MRKSGIHLACLRLPDAPHHGDYVRFRRPKYQGRKAYE